MIIRRILNNSVVSAVDDQAREVILEGRGIGFRSKPGDRVDPATVDRIYRPGRPGADRGTSSSEAVPAEVLLAVSDLVDAARRRLPGRIGDGVQASLCDHLAFAVERTRRGIPLANPLEVDVRRTYPDEYGFARDSLPRLSRALGVTLPPEEATNIALHLVTAQLADTSADVTSILDITHDVLEVVRADLAPTADEDSRAHLRFLTHLRYFARCVLARETSGPGDLQLHEHLRREYPAVFACVDRVAELVATRYGHEVGPQERTYLALHLVNLL